MPILYINANEGKSIALEVTEFPNRPINLKKFDMGALRISILDDTV